MYHPELVRRTLRLLAGGLLLVATPCGRAEERQITHGDAYNHVLDNNDNFSPDDRFLVFDTRGAGNIYQSKQARIESRRIIKVEISTGEITPLYEIENATEFGPAVMAVSYAHNRDEVIFIHGPLHPTGPDNQYASHRRIGAIISGDGSGAIRFADARDITPPFTAGALRGGTHRHEFSRDGQWIGHTYNDAVAHAFGRKTGKDFDLRTVGVTKLGHLVSVDKTPQFPRQGEGFSVLIVVVTPNPNPGSDEISHAAGDSWVGHTGYARTNGRRQLARAFIGKTRNERGQPHDEVFIVDIPDDITIPGPLGPLEGTETSFPMPPAGTVQRRLTRTANARYPGCRGIVRSSFDGELIAFQMRDRRGQWQIFLIAPTGGKPRRATYEKGGVTSDARWHPSGNSFAYTSGNKLLIKKVRPRARSRKSVTLSSRAPAPFALVWSHDGKTLAYNRTVRTNGKDVRQIFVADYEE
jgi:hypothetical protein